MQVLVINSGSSSVKFELFATNPERSLLEGEVERIGESHPSMWIEVSSAETPSRSETQVSAVDHVGAMGAILSALRSAAPPVDISDISVVGHRIVHGGSEFTEPTLISEAVLTSIRSLGLLAPVHAKANVAGIEAAEKWFPDASHVAVFDTSFHHTLPPRAAEYALPRDITRRMGIRRYGFHGTSHEYVSQRAAELLGRSPVNLITLHLGNGASVAAIEGGRCVDTSMGMTPLEGLVMGTRCGDLDPAVPMLLGEVTHSSREDVNRMMNFDSGLKGLCGESDMREVHHLASEGDADAILALDMFCYRAKKYIGAYFAVLGVVDAIVFTAGVGEHDAEIRARICTGLERLGIAIDPALNNAPSRADDGERFISPRGAGVHVLAIPTDEELQIARAAIACAAKHGALET